MPMSDNKDHVQVAVFSNNGVDLKFHINGDRETIWGTCQQIAKLFECTEENVYTHVSKIYTEKELGKVATAKQFLVVQTEGQRVVKRNVDHFNLDVILAVGYRVNSRKATDFRKWATNQLSALITTGYVLNERRLSEDHGAQDELANKLRAIRHEEQSMYGRVRDVFKESSADYDASSQTAKAFFAMAQDKFHFAITGKTASEIILARADAKKPTMGLRTIKGDAPTVAEAEVAKNYLSDREIKGLENLCEQFMLFAESMAFRGRKMTMEELSFKLNTLLAANEYQVLYEYKAYLRASATTHARKQLEAYRKRIGPTATKKQLPSGH
jgi:hypothetical protein